jgi:hypothetical protein
MAEEYGPVYCEGCGERVPIPERREGNPGVMREERGSDAGRVTWLYANEVIHQCNPGTYLPLGQVAEPRSS